MLTVNRPDIVSTPLKYDTALLITYPQPVRIGKRTVAWKEADIDACIASMNRGSAAI